MTHDKPSTVLTAVPTAVQHHMRFHLGVLREITQGLAQARLEASLAALATIQALAEAKGLDWAALCTALGGDVSPPAVGPAVEAWRPSAAPRQAR